MQKPFWTPLLSLAIMVPATYLVIGPIADTVGKALASGYTGLVGLNPVIAGGTAWSDLAGSSHVWCTLGICSDCYE